MENTFNMVLEQYFNLQFQVYKAQIYYQFYSQFLDWFTNPVQNDNNKDVNYKEETEIKTDSQKRSDRRRRQREREKITKTIPKYTDEQSSKVNAKMISDYYGFNQYFTLANKKDRLYFENEMLNSIRASYDRFIANKFVDFKEERTKSGVGIDRITLRTHKSRINELNFHLIPFRGPISITKGGEWMFIHIEAELIVNSLSIGEIIARCFRFLAEDMKLFNDRVWFEVTKKYDNPIRHVSGNIFRYFTISYFEVAFDFELPNFLQFINISDFKKVKNTYYSRDLNTTQRKSLIAVYPRHKKIGSKKELYRLELRMSHNYLKNKGTKPEIKKILKLAPIQLAYYNADKLAVAMYRATFYKNIFKRLQKKIKDNPEHVLFLWMLNYAYAGKKVR